MVSLEMKNEIRFSTHSEKYCVEPCGENSWQFKKWGSEEVIKTESSYDALYKYVIDYCKVLEAQLTIFKIKDIIEEQISFINHSKY